VSVGRKIRELRKAKGMTQDALAEASGVSRITIANIERDAVDNPSRNTLEDLSKALGMTYAELIAEQGKSPVTEKPKTLQEAAALYGTPLTDQEKRKKAMIELLENYYLLADDEKKAGLIKSVQENMPKEIAELFIKFLKGEKL
jgi:transcriptional regulator with XRE-family HTH domain